MQLMRCGLALVCALLLLGCDGDEEAHPRPATTTGTATTTTTGVSADCRVPEASDPAAEEAGTVFVYFFCPSGLGERPIALLRRVPPGKGPLQSALEALVKGPDERERQAGFQSPFDGFEGQILMGVELTNGHAVVDFSRQFFEQTVGGGTAYTAFFFRTLDHTVLQFPTVKKVTYRIEGDARALCLEFQIVCESLTREEWEKREGA